MMRPSRTRRLSTTLQYAWLLPSFRVLQRRNMRGTLRSASTRRKDQGLHYKRFADRALCGSSTCVSERAEIPGKQRRVEKIGLDEARQLEQPDWPAWLPVHRLSHAIRVSRMADKSAGEVAELPAMLTRLQREGDGAGRAAFTLRVLGRGLSASGRVEEAAQRLLAATEQGRRKRRDAMRMMQVFRPLILALTEIDRLDQCSRGGRRSLAVDALVWP